MPDAEMGTQSHVQGRGFAIGSYRTQKLRLFVPFATWVSILPLFTSGVDASNLVGAFGYFLLVLLAGIFCLSQGDRRKVISGVNHC